MNKTRQWAIIAAVAVLVVLAGGWFGLVSGQRSKANTLKANAADIQSQIARLHGTLAMLESDKRNLPEQQKILAEIATKIPAAPDEAALIRQMNGIANTAGVDMSTVTYGTPAQTSGATSSTTESFSGTTTSTASAGSLSLYSIPLSISVSGTYFNTEMFFHAAEQLSRAMIVTGFSVAPGSTAPQYATDTSAQPNLVTATITADVFLSPPAAPVTPTTQTLTNG